MRTELTEQEKQKITDAKATAKAAYASYIAATDAVDAAYEAAENAMLNDTEEKEEN